MNVILWIPPTTSLQGVARPDDNKSQAIVLFLIKKEGEGNAQAPSLIYIRSD